MSDPGTVHTPFVDVRKPGGLLEVGMVDLHGSATPLSVVAKRNGDTICLEVSGDIDMTTADRFRAAMVAALGEPVDHVIVDLEGVRFMDSSGIAALVFAHDHSASYGSTLRVINCRPNVRQVLEITNVYDFLIRQPPA